MGSESDAEDARLEEIARIEDSRLREVERLRLEGQSKGSRVPVKGTLKQQLDELQEQFHESELRNNKLEALLRETKRIAELPIEPEPRNEEHLSPAERQRRRRAEADKIRQRLADRELATKQKAAVKLTSMARGFLVRR